jgi:hypothetical protein
MQVAVCIQSAHNEVYQQKMRWFAEGVSDACDVVQWTSLPNDHKKYVPVIYGSVKKNRSAAHHRIKSQVFDHGRPFVMLETPLVHRRADTIDHGWLRVGINGFLWDDALWGFNNMDPNRKIVKPIRWRKNGDHILILMQNPGDASLRGADIFEWVENTVIELRKHTDRPIRIRPHPLPNKQQKLENLKKKLTGATFVENKLPDNLRPLQADFENCWCVVTYSSGSSVDAVMAGIPNIACDSGNMAWPISSTKLNMIEHPYTGDTELWEQQISHCQFSVEELRNGLCWNHIKQSL